MKEMINKIKNAAPKNVVVIGDIMLDEYLFGSATRISPEAPVPVVKEVERSWCLGGAANVAANCRHIGLNTTLVGVMGDDDVSGRKIISLMNDLSIKTDGIVKSSSHLTTRKQRIMVDKHQMLRIDVESDIPLSLTEEEDLCIRYDAMLTPGAIVLISDYGKGVINQRVVAYIVQQAKAKECRVLVDPKGPDFNKYRGVDIIKPNLKEFNQMISFFGLSHQDSLISNARRMCKLLMLKAMVITLGDKGIHLVTPKEILHVPAVRREVFDLTGAGDTVFAFLALGLLHECSYDMCLRLANAAASVAVSHVKTYAVSLDELIDRQIEPSEKVFSNWASLKIELDWLRADGRKVVFTNGCFDILHSGHIHTLRQAKRYGDILVVGLNSDASVRRLKGCSRPINPIEERAAVLSALGCVDFVVIFDEDTPLALIDYLRPNVLVKGGDYVGKNIFGSEIVLASGGSVEVVPYIQGRSTTRVIELVKERDTI